MHNHAHTRVGSAFSLRFVHELDLPPFLRIILLSSHSPNTHASMHPCIQQPQPRSYHSFPRVLVCVVHLECLGGRFPLFWCLVCELAHSDGDPRQCDRHRLMHKGQTKG